MRIESQPTRSEVKVFMANPISIEKIVSGAEAEGWTPIGGPYVVPCCSGYGYEVPINPEPSWYFKLASFEVHIMMRRTVCGDEAAQ